MKQVVGQHYIPKFYLRGFTIPGTDKLWVYDKNKPAPRKQSPAKVAKEKYFYSDWGQGETDNTLEDTLAKIESAVAPILRRLETQDVAFADREERYVFGRFVSFLAFRTRQFNRHFHILGQNIIKTRMINHFEKKGGLGVVVEEFNRKANMRTTPGRFLDSFNKIKIKPRKGSFQVVMAKAALQMIPYFCSMNWIFVRSTGDDYFVTSDAPVVFFDPKNNDSSFKPGILQKNVQIYFPVNRQLCLVTGWPRTGGYFHAERSLVRDINAKIAWDSESFVFSPAQYQIGLKEIHEKVEVRLIRL